MSNKKQLVKLSPVQLKELVNYLLGSVNTLDGGLESIGLEWGQLDMSSFNAIDALIFKCEHCSWWYEENENSGQNVCQGCAGIDEEDEDIEDESFIEEYSEDLNDGDDIEDDEDLH